ncbi:MAG: hypothetical protein NUV50_08995 [Rhodospirillales bacterium]|nr:hypothetical protein [Rhodospirillales bacterium]
MRKITSRCMAFVAVTLLTSSCLHDAAAVDKEKMLGLGSALTKVSSAVHVTVFYDHPPADLRDAALLTVATEHNPALLNAFDGHVLKARQEGKNSSVLVCDKTGKTALIEDAGCTGTPDLHIWESRPDQPCGYVLDLATVCAAP